MEHSLFQWLRQWSCIYSILLSEGNRTALLFAPSGLIVLKIMAMKQSGNNGWCNSVQMSGKEGGLLFRRPSQPQKWLKFQWANWKLHKTSLLNCIIFSGFVMSGLGIYLDVFLDTRHQLHEKGISSLCCTCWENLFLTQLLKFRESVLHQLHLPWKMLLLTVCKIYNRNEM